MAIDYIIGYDCVPKHHLTAEGIIDRVKARDRAETVIALYREGGDQRPPSEMEFEMSRVTPAGEEESRVVNIQMMLDSARDLDPWAPYCKTCPANAAATPFGCYNIIQYPISAAAERWLLDRLPGIEEPLMWLLLRQGALELGYDGASVAPLRSDPSYFEEQRLPGRDLVEFVFTGNQVFEMLFLVGTIQPSHAGMLLLLFGAIPRGVEADQIVGIMQRGIDIETIDRDYLFQFTADELDDESIRQFKAFFYAVYKAWRLGVPVGLDV
ncbi:MAG: hypothetical protein SGJ24_11495 [Chloroflexota bacterium]|nr:hypothetical protein [Chloroflexota bacterium]